MRGRQRVGQTGAQLEAVSQARTCSTAHNFSQSIEVEQSSLPHSSDPFPRSGHMGVQLELTQVFELVVPFGLR